MTREIRKELNRARRLYQSKKHEEAYEIYDSLYMKNPEAFDHWDKVRYCWCMYYLFIRNPKDDSQLFEYVEMVTDTVKQEDINVSPVCVYTQCVFKAIMHLKKQDDWEYMLYWLDKLNPELLNEDQNESNGVVYPSKKEEYYKFLTTALLKCGDYEECIEASQKALQSIKVDFAFDGDVWLNWRIGKSLMGLDQYGDALTYFEKVMPVKNDWYIYKDMAICSHEILRDGDALKYARQAVMAEGPSSSKVNLYCLIYKILKDSNPEAAMMHAELFLALKIESGAHIPEEIEDLDIDEESLDIHSLESQVSDFWKNYEGD